MNMRTTVIFLIVLLPQTVAKIEPGIFYYPSPNDASANSVPRTFFGNSSLEAKVECTDAAKKAGSKYHLYAWSFRTICYKSYNDQNYKAQIESYVNYLLSPNAENSKRIVEWEKNWNTAWIRCFKYKIVCNTIYPVIETRNKSLCEGYRQLLNSHPLGGEKKDSEAKEDNDANGSSRKKRAITNSVLQKFQNGIKYIATGSDPHTGTYYRVVNITKTGSFYIGWYIQAIQGGSVSPDYITLTIKAKDKHGYLEGKDYPLVLFYGLMSGVYALLTLIWLLVCGYHWRDILQVQLWIGGLLILSMIEMSVYCNKYMQVNNGYRVADALVVFGELLSTFKHGLSRVLVLVICMGFGIVKPKLGSSKHLVFALGLAYCLFLSIDSIYERIVAPYKPMTMRQQLYAFIPRAVINAIMIWWIIVSLVSTIRTLRLRRNVIKLSLYRHFSNCLIFAIVSFIAFEAWWRHLTKDGCVKNWKEYWLSDEIFWNLLFTLVLIVIMVLWRPTVNNSRYAFSPLLDADEEEEEEEAINEAFEGMKLRNIKKNGSTAGGTKKTNIDEDLKWVEENIPSTIGDTVFETFVDSDEEKEQRKYEMSKMQ